MLTPCSSPTVLETFKASFATESSSQDLTDWVEVAVFLVSVDMASFGCSESLMHSCYVRVPNLHASRNRHPGMELGEGCVPRLHRQGLAVLLVHDSGGKQICDPSICLVRDR